MKVLNVTVIALVISMVGCNTTVIRNIEEDNAAKIRVFHSGSIYLHPNQTCFGADNPQSIRAAVGGYSFMVSNHKVGMPITEDTSWSYHEYLIPAGKPLTVEMNYSIDGFSCGPIGAFFVPEKGKNYDTKMMFDSSTDTCSVRVRELNENERERNKATAVLKAIVIAPKC